MIFFPNCKINLGLHILQKRPDGFHDLETIFLPLPLQDALEVIQPPSPTQQVQLSVSGIEITGDPDDNICVKAYRLLKNDFPELPSVHVHLHKIIPLGAGLGGGSADGAFTLLLLNKKFNLKLDEKTLIAYAQQLGSDCPFFIKNSPCFATGRGELLQQIELDLSACRIIIVNPGIHINTALAFSKSTPRADRISLKELILSPIVSWKQQLSNDFEPSVFAAYPEIRKIKDTLYQNGAVYASMSGSGSTVYGIFEKTQTPAFDFPPHYFIRHL